MTNKTERELPINAQTPKYAVTPPKRIANKLATAAPPDTPNTYGSAKGLRNNVCIKAPARANNPPVIKAQNALGIRI